jgi:DNA polymerase V
VNERQIRPKGRPPEWGSFEIDKGRPSLPLEITSEIARIRERFTDGEQAANYILDCLTNNHRMYKLKLYDCRISATPGITAADDSDGYEEKDVPLSLLKKPTKSFLVKVSGDSMKDAGIRNGNIILVEKIDPLYENPPDKSIVTAYVDGQLVVKRYRRHRNKVELLSENRRKAYPPIIISPESSEDFAVFIFGIYQQVIDDSMVISGG